MDKYLLRKDTLAVQQIQQFLCRKIPSFLFDKRTLFQFFESLA